MDDQTFRAHAALIDDSNYSDFEAPTIDGHKFATGLAPRDYSKRPMFAALEEFPDSLLLDDHDLKLAFEQQIADHSSLFDLREMSDGYLDSLDQDGLGLCWYFNLTKCLMYCRERAGLPRVPLSPWWGSGKINHWRDQGGYIEKAAAHAMQHGAPPLALCPSYDKKYDTSEAEQAALDHLLLEAWETSQDPAKRNHQFVSGAAHGFPMGCDYNCIGHSMAFARMARWGSKDDYDTDSDNSWTMKSGFKGLYRFKGKKSRPDACVIFRVTKATDK